MSNAIVRAAMLGALAGFRMPTRTPRTLALRGTARRGVVSLRRRKAMAYRRPMRRMTRRRWQARARRNVAHPKNFSTSKTTESILPGATAGDSAGFLTAGQQRLINFPGLIKINRGTEINQRLRDTVFISGVKIDANFKNLSGDRVFVNWAVIHPKQDQLVTQTQTDFFRDYTDSRTWDAGSNQKTGLSWSNAKINTDEYIILKRGKFMLCPSGVTGGNAGEQGSIEKAVSFNSKDNQKSISHWVKIGRNFTFQDTPTTAPNDQLYFVFWVADESKGAGNNTTGSTEVRLRCVIYFREPRTA